MMDRLISLSVGTDGAEDYFRTFQDISELARNLGAVHDYVTVSASAVVGGSDDEPDEDLFYDENTLVKVREAIMRRGIKDDLATLIITDLQNAGILFRERR